MTHFNHKKCVVCGKCCLHSFYRYYIFSIYFHCSASIAYHDQKANWLYQERKFPGTFVPGREGSHWELSLRGAKIPGERKVLIATSEVLRCRSPSRCPLSSLTRQTLRRRDVVQSPFTVVEVDLSVGDDHRCCRKPHGSLCSFLLTGTIF